jgi:endonuclease/exonuclease/phosphatase (EEP) superfamily protein YafD
MRKSSAFHLLVNWIDSLFFWYALGLIVILLARFVLQADWWWLLLLLNGAPYLFLPVLFGYLAGLILRQRRLIATYLLLLVAGVLWVLIPMLPPFFAAAPQGMPVRLLTFNAFPENPDLAPAENWLLQQNADIVLLQELFGAIPALRDAYPHQAEQERGLLLLSRFPVLENESVMLDGLQQQRVVLEIDGTPVTIYNLHLFMPLNEDESQALLLRYDEQRRNRQIDELLARLTTEEGTLLVAGDFNMSEWSPVYGRLRAALRDAYRASAWGIGATWPGGASEELDDFLPPLLRLDYVFYRGAIEPAGAQVGIALGSDHLPLLVNLRLTESVEQ